MEAGNSPSALDFKGRIQASLPGQGSQVGGVSYKISHFVLLLLVER